MTTRRIMPEEALSALRAAQAAGMGVFGNTLFSAKEVNGDGQDQVCALGACYLAATETFDAGSLPAVAENGGMWRLVKGVLGISDAYEAGFGRAFNAMPPNFCTGTPDDGGRRVDYDPEYALGYVDGLRVLLGARYRGLLPDGYRMTLAAVLVGGGSF